METPQNPDKLNGGTVDAELQDHLDGSPNPATSAEAAPRVLSLDEYLATPGFPDEIKEFFLQNLNWSRDHLDDLKKEDKQDVSDFVTDKIRLLESDPLRYLLKELDYVNNNLSYWLNPENITNRTEEEIAGIQSAIYSLNYYVNKYTKYIKELEEIVQKSPVPDSSSLTPSETQTDQMPQNEQTPEPSGSVTEQKEKRPFVVPQELIKKVEELNLASSGRLKGLLAFLQRDDLKIEQIKKEIDRRVDMGLLDDEDRNEMFAILDSQNSEESKEETKEYSALNTENIIPKETCLIKTNDETYLLERKDDGFLYIKGGQFGESFEKIKKYQDGVDAIGTNLFTPGHIETGSSFYVYIDTVESSMIQLSLINKIEKTEHKKEKTDQQLEKETTELLDLLEQEIKSAKNFDELYEILRNSGGFDAHGHFYQPEELIQRIETFRIYPNRTALANITKEKGLRSKVEQLQNQYLNEQNSTEPEQEKTDEQPEKETTLDTINPPAPLMAPPLAQEATPRGTSEPEAVHQPAPEAISDVEAALAEARENYANVLIEYKNKHREHKAWYQKILSDLGFEKSLHDMPVPKGMEDLRVALEDAENGYISAKKEKAKEITLIGVGIDEIKKVYPDFVAGQGVSEEMADALYKVRLIEQAEKEWDTLQKKILENTPPKEAGKIRKAFAVWQRVPLKVRMSLSVVVLPVLVGTAAVFAMPATAAGGLAVGASVAGLRSARAIGGIVGSGLAGKGFDILENKLSKSFHKSVTDQYNVDEDNFEEKERNLMRGFEENQRLQKQAKVAKTATMVAGGLSVGLLAGMLESPLEAVAKTHLGGVANGVDSARPNISARGVVPETKAGVAVEQAATHKPWWKFWGGDAENTSADTAHTQRLGYTEKNRGNLVRSKIETPDIPKPRPLTDIRVKPSEYNMGKSDGTVSPDASHTPPTVEPVKIPNAPVAPQAETVASVELSEHGYIQTFIDLKAKLNAKYPDLNSADVPPGVKHFLSTPSTKLAQEYGFWDAKAGTSAMGLKGEHLIVDSGGNLKLEHLAGKPSEMIDTTTHKFDTIHHDQMKVFGPETPSHKVAIHDTGTKTVPPNESDGLNSLMENQTRSTLYGEYRPVAPMSDYDPNNIGAGHSGAGHEILNEYGEPITRVPYGSSTPSHFENNYTPKHIYSDTMYHSVITGKDMNVKVMDTGGGHDGVVIDGQPIATSVPMPHSGSRMVLEDIYQDGKNYRAVREAFTAVYNDYLRAHLPRTGEVAGHTFQFENGQIDIARGLSENPNQIDLLLNGKKFGSGVMTAHGPKLTMDHTLSRHSWWQPHTVYDRAFENLKHNLGLKKFKGVVADFTVAKK